MANVLVDDTSLTNIANAIRTKEGEQAGGTMTPAQMSTRIANLPSGGISEVESVSITNKSAFENLSFQGTYLTIPLAVTILPANAPQISQVVVSDPKMIHVLDNGDGTHSLHILKGGTCTVTVKDYSGTITDSMTVTISVALQDISFPYSSLNVAEGGTRQLAVQFKPSTASNQTIVWSSSHSDITVDQNGLVTANGTGHAVISAYNAELDKTITCAIECAAYVDTPDWAYIKAHKNDYGVGSEFTDVLRYNNTDYTIVYRVVHQDYPVTKADGTSATAMILMATQSLPFTNKYSTESPTTCDSATEQFALADTYYYGKSGSTYTALNVEVGDPLPYSDYDSIYKSGLHYTKNLSGIITQTRINRWDGSEVRAIFNSDADNVKNSYTPVHITDRVNYTGKGFLQMINPNLLTVVERIKNTTVENNSCFDGNTYETDDLFWLPAARQLNYILSTYDYRPSSKDELEGTPFQYFIDQIGTAHNNAAACRSITPIGSTSAGQYWLRSGHYTNTNFEYYGNADGSLYNGSAFNTYRLLPACAIC